MEKNSTSSKKQVVVFDIDSQGIVTQQLTDNPQETTLENTLLQAIYPDIKVAMVNVPTGFLDGYEESVVANAMVTIHSNGTEYRLIGASGAAKEGKFYLVDADHAQAIGKRFQFWPEAAIVYFGILVSPCRVTLDEENLTVLVVEHRLEAVTGSRRPTLHNLALFHGINGTLPSDVLSGPANRESLPVFHTRSGDVRRIPEKFEWAVRKIVAASSCVGCKHCHVLEAEPSSVSGLEAESAEELRP